MMEQFRFKSFPCGFKEVVTATTQEPGSTIVSVERDKCITPETFNVIPVAKYDTGSTSVELFLESTGLWLVGVIDTSTAGEHQTERQRFEYAYRKFTQFVSALSYMRSLLALSQGSGEALSGRITTEEIQAKTGSLYFSMAPAFNAVKDALSALQQEEPVNVTKAPEAAF